MQASIKLGAIVALVNLYCCVLVVANRKPPSTGKGFLLGIGLFAILGLICFIWFATINLDDEDDDDDNKNEVYSPISPSGEVCVH